MLAVLICASGCGGDNKAISDVPDAAVEPDAAVDGAPVLPQIAGLSYPVIAHGGALVITGANLAGATEVAIGGVAHTDLADVTDTAVTVTTVLDTVPTGVAQELTVTTPLGTSAGFELAVIHLVISEVEVDSPGADTRDFVELSTGVAEPLSLDGYLLVLYQGAAGGPVNALLDLDAMTDANGLMLIGPTTLVATPQVVFDGPIDNGEDAVAVYQFAAAPNNFPASLAEAGTTGLLDALIYETNADNDQIALADLLTDAVVVDEGPASAARDTVSIQRCPADLTRRLGASYRLEIPTPGRPNVNCDAAPAALADCTIDFDGSCPDVVAGECGAIFVSNGGCETPDVAQCVDATDGFRGIDNGGATNRIDIFLTGELDSLDTFLAPFQGTSATMQFFALDGALVGTPLAIGADCQGTAAIISTADLGAGAVRRIQVDGDADIFIDGFRTNP
jgi:hypothetical protein